jgi:ferredoxin-NADP reductase
MTTEAKWPIYSLKLKSRSEVAERTLEFRFDKPAGMTFKAGQFMDREVPEGGPSPGKELSGPIYYMAGPPAMVAGLRTMLNKAGVDDDDIRTEEFAGY